MSDVILNSTSTFITQAPLEYITIVSAAQGPQGIAGAGLISELQDVDLTTLNNGALLIYNAQASKWVSSTTLEKQIVDSGQY